MKTAASALLIFLLCTGFHQHSAAKPQLDQLAVEASSSTASVAAPSITSPLASPSTPLAQLLATAKGKKPPAPITPTAPRIRRKLSKFNQNRKRFFPRSRLNSGVATTSREVTEDDDDNLIVSTVPSTSEHPLPSSTTKGLSSRFAAFGRRPRPSEAPAVTKKEIPNKRLIEKDTNDAVKTKEEMEETKIKQQRKIAEEGKKRQPVVKEETTISAVTFRIFTPTVLPDTTTTTLSPPVTFKLEDYFGTPEPPRILPREQKQPILPLAASTKVSLDVSNNLEATERLIKEVNSRTSALTGAQAIGVSRDVIRHHVDRTDRQLGPVLPIKKDPENFARSRPRSTTASRRHIDKSKNNLANLVAASKATIVPSPKRIEKKPLKTIGLLHKKKKKKKKKQFKRHNGKRKSHINTVQNYRVTNADGSITWGYENEDGSFKEETIGADCVTHGKYGYIDPSGEVREYSYTSGNRCDPDTKKVTGSQTGQSWSRGPNGHGFYDYKRNKFVMADGRRVTVVVNQSNKARGRRY